MKRHQLTRAALTGLSVLITGLMVYQGIPESIDALWQPTGQGLLTFLSALGIGAAVKSPR